MYERLDATEILRTAERLEHRIVERFPKASLSKLAARLVAIIRESIIDVTRLRRPNIWLRMGVGLFLVAAFTVLVIAVPDSRDHGPAGAPADRAVTQERA